jgi:hypothetical protein
MPPQRTASQTYLPLVIERKPNHRFLPLVGLHRHMLGHHHLHDMAMCAGLYHSHRQHITRTLGEPLPPGDGMGTLLGLTKKLLAAMAPPATVIEGFSAHVNAMNTRFEDVRMVRKRAIGIYRAVDGLVQQGEEGGPEGHQLLDSMTVSYEAAAISLDERLSLYLLQNRLNELASEVAARINSVENAYRFARLINYASGLRIEEATGVRLPDAAGGPSHTRRMTNGPVRNLARHLVPAMVNPLDLPPQAMPYPPAGVAPPLLDEQVAETDEEVAEADEEYPGTDGEEFSATAGSEDDDTVANVSDLGRE